MKPSKNSNIYNELIQEIKDIISNAKSKIRQEINSSLIFTYWQIGKIIVEKERKENLSSRKLILELSKELTKEIGRGFSRSNLFNMRQFHLKYKSV